MKFVVACKKVFGQKKDQTLKEFLEETKKLTKKDRQELTPLLEETIGQEIEKQA